MKLLKFLLINLSVSLLMMSCGGDSDGTSGAASGPGGGNGNPNNFESDLSFLGAPNENLFNDWNCNFSDPVSGRNLEKPSSKESFLLQTAPNFLSQRSNQPLRFMDDIGTCQEEMAKEPIVDVSDAGTLSKGSSTNDCTFTDAESNTTTNDCSAGGDQVSFLFQDSLQGENGCNAHIDAISNLTLINESQLDGTYVFTAYVSGNCPAEAYDYFANCSRTINVSCSPLEGGLGDLAPDELPAPNALEVPEYYPGNLAIRQIETSYDAVYAIDENGDVWAWGRNTYKKLGVNSIFDTTLQETHTNRPVKIKSLNNIVKISAGRLHTLALDRAGDVWIWGTVLQRENGECCFQENILPERVSNLMNIQDIHAGRSFSVALNRAGQIFTWGRNSFDFELGRQTNGTDLVPTAIDNVTVDAILGGSQKSTYFLSGNDILVTGQGLRILERRIPGEQIASASFYFDMGAYVTDDGDVYLHGSADTNIPGDDFSFRLPTQYMDLQNIQSVAVGENHILALDRNGDVFAFGGNEYGEIGNNNRSDFVDPPFQIQRLQNIIQIEASWDFSYALDREGRVYSWGRNAYHVLGNTDPFVGIHGTLTPECVFNCI